MERLYRSSKSFLASEPSSPLIRERPLVLDQGQVGRSRRVTEPAPRHARLRHVRDGSSLWHIVGRDFLANNEGRDSRG